jgi:hypothetical protein
LFYFLDLLFLIFPIKVGDVVLFRNHRRGEWEEGIIKGRIECWGAGEELYTVSTSSEDYIVKLLRRVSR